MKAQTIIKVFGKEALYCGRKCCCIVDGREYYFQEEKFDSCVKEEVVKVCERGGCKK